MIGDCVKPLLLPYLMRRNLAWMVACLSLSACSLQGLVNHQLANQLSADGLSSEDDVGLAHDASAFYLKLSEATLKNEPQHIALAQAVTCGLTQYAYAFISQAADELQSTDAEKSNQLRERAKRMYARAQTHGMKALELNQVGLTESLFTANQVSASNSNASRVSSSQPLKLDPQLVGLAYWSAAAWAARISLSTDEPEVVADFPQVVTLAQLAYQTNPQFGKGSLASLLGVLEMARPGGSKSKALNYFDQAIQLANAQDAGPWVSKAESYALPMGDKAQFELLLTQTLEFSKTHHDLSSQIMSARAKWLLTQIEDLF